MQQGFFQQNHNAKIFRQSKLLDRRQRAEREVKQVRCKSVQERFSPWLDGELSEIERIAVEEHLAGCPRCRAELKAWEEISASLRGLKSSVSAPEGFAAGVIARLETMPAASGVAGALEAEGLETSSEAGKGLKTAAKRGGFALAKALGLGSRWGMHLGMSSTARRWAASAAAVVLLASSSLGIAFHYWGSSIAPRIAGIPGIANIYDRAYLPPAEGDNAGASTTSGISGTLGANSAVSPLPGNGATGNSSSEASAPGEGGPPAATGESGAGKSGAAVSPSPTGSSGETSIAAVSLQPKVFLSKERVITSTLVKIQVADLDAAQAQLNTLRKNYGATSQVLARQANGASERYIVKLVAAPEKEAALITALGQLGTVVSQTTETQNITANFEETLEEYRATIAQLNSAADAAQAQELIVRARDLENLLNTWDKEAEKRVIVVWLEG